MIPVYNEAEGIEKMIGEVYANLKEYKDKFKIIVINDGSADGTTEILERINKIWKDISVINHEANFGLDKVFKSGFKIINEISSTDDIVATIEGDGTNDLSILVKMIERIKDGYDIVIASRMIQDSKYIGFPILRKIISVCGNKILNKIFSLNGITDYTILYRAYSTRIIKEFFNKNSNNLLTVKGFAANTEILLKLGKLTSKICEIPLVYRYDLKKSKSKLKLSRTVFQYLKLIYKAIL